MISPNKKVQVSDVIVEIIVNDLDRIYSNKSDDEFKIKGDITASPTYSNIELMVANLSTIKRLPKDDISALKNMFNTLHRPMFKKMVSEYIAEPNERNVIFTGVFTVGYRLLINELVRIYTSSESRVDGYIYKPDRISRNSSCMLFIKKYSADMENKIDTEIRRLSKKTMSVQEAAVAETLGSVVDTSLLVIEGFFGFINNIFRTAASLNPVSLISAILSRSYDKKVEKYNEVSALYMSSKQAYDDYMKIPVSQRKKRTEHKYVKMIEKYNIKMGNIKAQLDHFDMRAMEEYKDATSNPNAKRKGLSLFKKKKDKAKTETSKDTGNDDKTPDISTKDAENTENSTENNNDDDFDF